MGNVPLDVDRRQIKKIFTAHGEIEKIWFRSIATEHDSKQPHKAKIIQNNFGQQKDNKNAYVLFKTKEQAQMAAKAMN